MDTHEYTDFLQTNANMHALLKMHHLWLMLTSRHYTPF